MWHHGWKARSGGQPVRPGDWIVGDDNGVMVVPQERAYEVARRELEVNKNEDRVRVEIDRVKTLAQVMDLYKGEKISREQEHFWNSSIPRVPFLSSGVWTICGIINAKKSEGFYLKKQGF
jgi:hypothetical protein